MAPSTLKQLREEVDVEFLDRGLKFPILESWVVPGETRVSYTTITQLVECCREYHWQKDIDPLAPPGTLDSITKNLHLEFHQPIPTKSTISIVYRILEVRQRAYRLGFSVSTDNENNLSTAEMVSVFCQPNVADAIRPPKRVSQELKAMMEVRTLALP